jgi:regulator of Ty1 transposition protein 103
MVAKLKHLSTTQKQTLGGSFFKDSSAGSTPSELQPLVPIQVAVTKAAMASNTAAKTATTEYEKMHDPHSQQPPPPVQAARLSQLLKTLASAESSVSEVIKSRRALIDGLEKLLATNRSELSKEESLASQLAERKTEIDSKKREVEDAIMGGSTDDASGAHSASAQSEDAGRPQVEALTPPPVEAITPVGSPKPEPSHATHGPFTDEPEEPLPGGFSLPDIGQPDDGSAFPDPSSLSPGGGNDFDLGAHGSGAKRRKTTHEEEDYSQFAGGDLDDDVAALLASQGK